MHRIQTLFPEITPGQMEQLAGYCDLLRDWNRRVNLVSRKDVEQLVAHHLLPSLLPLKLVELPREAWLLDIGSGGGLPALPIAIMRPDVQILMVDSIRKKTVFLKSVIEQLALPRVAVLNDRIEQLQGNPDFVEKFDVITARAVTSVKQLLEWGAPFRKSGGFFLFWKGESDIPELSLKTVAQYRHQIHRPPAHYHSLSRKFSGLCWFEINP